MLQLIRKPKHSFTTVRSRDRLSEIREKETDYQKSERKRETDREREKEREKEKEIEREREREREQEYTIANIYAVYTC